MNGRRRRHGARVERGVQHSGNTRTRGRRFGLALVLAAWVATAGEARAPEPEAADTLVGELAAVIAAEGGTARLEALRSLAEGLRPPAGGGETPFRAAAPLALPALDDALADPDPVVRTLTVECIGLMGRDAFGAQTALIEAARDPDPSVARKVQWALLQILPRPPGEAEELWLRVEKAFLDARTASLRAEIRRCTEPAAPTPSVAKASVALGSEGRFALALEGRGAYRITSDGTWWSLSARDDAPATVRPLPEGVPRWIRLAIVRSGIVAVAELARELPAPPPSPLGFTTAIDRKVPMVFAFAHRADTLDGKAVEVISYRTVAARHEVWVDAGTFQILVRRVHAAGETLTETTEELHTDVSLAADLFHLGTQHVAPPGADAGAREVVASFAAMDVTFEAAVQSLRARGPDVVESLEHVLADPDPSVREAAMELLGRLGGSAVPAIVRALAAGDAPTRCEALRILGAMGSVARGASSAIVAETRDGDREVRRAALGALGSIGSTESPVLEALARGLEEHDPTISVAAAFASLRLGVEPTPAFTLLRSQLGTRNNQILDGIARIHDVPRLLPFVAGTVSHRDPSIAMHAIHILETWGRRASAAAPELEAALRDTRPEVASSAARALAEVDGAAWDAAYDRGDAPVRRALAASLESRSPQTASRRKRALVDPDAQVRAEAARHATPADARDHALLGRPDTRIEAAEAMLRRGETLEEAIGALGRAIATSGEDRLRALRVLHDALRGPILQALREAPDARGDGPAGLPTPPVVVAAAAVVDALRAALGDPDPDAVELAADCLGLVGAPARRASPELVAIRGHASRSVRVRAVAALAAVGAPEAPTPADEKRAAEIWSRVETAYLDAASVAVDVTFSARGQTSGATVRRSGSQLVIATDGRGATKLTIDDHTFELGSGTGEPGRKSPASPGASREVMRELLRYGVAGTLTRVMMGASYHSTGSGQSGLQDIDVMTREPDEVVGGRTAAVLELVTATDATSHRVFVDPDTKRILRHEWEAAPGTPPMVETYRDAAPEPR